MIESEIDRGIFVSRVEAERTGFHQLIDRYISEIAPKHKGAYSEIKRLEALKRHPLATRIVATLTSSDFAHYRDERLKIRKGNTVKRELALFQCVIEVARREWGIHLAENPVRMVSRPSYNDERSRRLDPIEEQYILNALELRERRADGTYADASHNPSTIHTQVTQLQARPHRAFAASRKQKNPQIAGFFVSGPHWL